MNRFIEYTDSKAGITGGKGAFSLVELLVVLAIIAMLVIITIPAIKAMQKSFDSTGADGMISSALSTARTIAIKNNQYAGVRFQKIGDPNNVLEANQYMIFVIYDSNGETGTSGWACGFVAVAGYKPIKLPENVSVMDKIIVNRSLNADCDCTLSCVENQLAPADLSDSAVNVTITDTSAFSIVFSPSGKLVIEKLRCGKRRNNNNDIFVGPPTGMFVEDNYEDSGIGVENSRREFYIYDKEKFKNLTDKTQRLKYLDSLNAMCINPYTGEIISKH